MPDPIPVQPQNVQPADSPSMPVSQPSVPAEPAAVQPPPPVQPPPTVPAPLEPTVPQPSEVQPLSVRDQLTAMGYDTSGFTDDESMVKALVGAASSAEQNRPLIQAGQEYLQNANEFHKWQGEQQQAAQQQQQAEEKPPKPTWEWDAPEFDPTWMYQVDEEGNLRPGADPMLAQKLRQYQQWKLQKEAEFYRNPQQLINAAVEDRFTEIQTQAEQRSQEIAAQMVSAYDLQQQQQRWIEANKQRFYQLDAGGNIQRDVNNAEVYTPEGQVFLQHVMEARNRGADPLMARDYAENAVAAMKAQGHFAQPAPTPAPAAQQQTAPMPTNQRSSGEIARDNKGRFMQKAIAGLHEQERGGTIPDESAPVTLAQNPDAALREITRGIMHDRGMYPQTG